MLNTNGFYITADRKVIGHRETKAWQREAWNRQWGGSLGGSDIPHSGRYNDSRQGANDCFNLTQKAWARWACGITFDSSDESFYSV
jgi:hypothetical protein